MTKKLIATAVLLTALGACQHNDAMMSDMKDGDAMMADKGGDAMMSDMKDGDDAMMSDAMMSDG